MKPMMLGLIAALSLAGSQGAVAQSSGGGELALHIEALGTAGPDMAYVSFTVTEQDQNAAAARAKLAKAVAAVRAKLAKAGIAAGDIKDGEVTVTQTPDYSAANAAAAAAADAAMAAGSAADAAASAEDATVAVPPPPVIMDSSENMPQIQQASMSITVKVLDLTKLDAVNAAARSDQADPNIYPSRPRAFYAARDPKAAHDRAVQMALANARTEADTYAASMGYRVVRMVRVSSEKPKLSWPDMMMLFGGYDWDTGPGMEDKMKRMTGSTYASAQVDYVIAPK